MKLKFDASEAPQFDMITRQQVWAGVGGVASNNRGQLLLIFAFCNNFSDCGCLF